MAAKNGVINLAKFLGKAACPEASYMQAAVQYSTGGGVAAYKLPELPYGYSALGTLHLSPMHAAVHHAPPCTQLFSRQGMCWYLTWPAQIMSKHQVSVHDRVHVVLQSL
jgi:hypothetical protein